MKLKKTFSQLFTTALCLITASTYASSSGLAATATSELTFKVDASISINHLDDIQIGQAFSSGQVWGWSNFCVARNSASEENPEKYLLIADGQNGGFQLSGGKESVLYNVRVLDKERNAPPSADEGHQLQPGIAHLDLKTSSNSADDCSNATVWVSVTDEPYEDGTYTDTLTLTVAPQ